ncbi:unnamed protein product [Blepharisma stoltei]|uniref:Receptor ligand binding region domain-containing protein n=1 Tax=Blepharisma stoltei TaxID=1481888 RepID=A0AAU9JBJ5_9CILI|nr:unnamed protein product [Blepharisma stoltei]
MIKPLLYKNHDYSGVGWMKTLLFFFLLGLSYSIDILAIVNDKNKLDRTSNEKQFLESMKNTEPTFEWHLCNYSTILGCIDMHPNTLIVLDLSDDLDIQLSMSKICRDHMKIHLALKIKYRSHYYNEWTYSIIPSYADQINAYLAILDYFNWTQGLVITNEHYSHSKQQFIEYSNNFEHLIVESSTNIEILINRVVKPLGATLYYIIANSVESLKIQNALNKAKLLSKGDGIVLNQDSGYGCQVDGALILTLMGQEYATSEEDYYWNETAKMMSFLIKNTIGTETIEELKLIFRNRDLINSFSIVNTQSGRREIVGSVINEKVAIFKNLTYPGKSKTIPKSEKKILQMTISGGTTNPGSPPLASAALSYMGAYTAWNFVNDGTLGILKNFQIEHFNFDCGVSAFNQSFATACFKKDIDKFKIAHISASGSSMTIGEMAIFKKLNLTFPIVGAVPSDYTLNSTALYPMFTRIIISNRYLYSLASLLIKASGWRKICVLYQNNTLGISGYAAFVESAINYGLEIVNPENMRAIPANLNRTSMKNYTEIFQAIVNTEARFIVNLIQVPALFYTLEIFYDMGIRKGDFVTFVATADNILFLEYDHLYDYKIKETGVPMLTIYGQNWVGMVGKRAYSKIQSEYKVSPAAYACYYYDAAYSISLAIDYLINQGLDYDNPYQASSAIRAQKFVGCTGRVSTDKNSNDRILDVFDVKVNEINATSGNVTSYIVGEFHPYSSPMLNIQQPIIYGDGTTVKQDDLRNQNNKCPFPDKSVRVFTKGRILVFGICFGVALISVIITSYIWKAWWNIPIEPLKERQEISVQDLIVEATIGIEFFQFSSMGPDFSPINGFLANISSSLSLNLENILKLENGVFWYIIEVVYGSIILWLILCIVILFRLDEKFPHISAFRFLAWLADFLMPILGNLCFIPFISMCLNVFVCDQSIGDNFTDSFLAQDCYYFCWKGEHLVYAIFSIIALLLYEPFAVFCRPLWQELQHTLHIHAAPIFLMVKTVVQIIFIVMNKTVKRAETTVHGILYIVIMIAYITFLFIYKPYNYPRVCWWQALSLIGVVWLAILSTISANIQANYLYYFLSLCLGWLLLAFIGIYVQIKKYPSLLFRKKGLDTTNLFKFAFGFGRHSKMALTKIAPARSSAREPSSREFSFTK